MDSKHRVVLHIPVTELWKEDGQLLTCRVRGLGGNDVRELLRSGAPEFVVADVGLRLEWISGDRIFAFWKDEVMPRLVQLPVERSRIADRAYVASEWVTVGGTTVVLLEKYH